MSNLFNRTTTAKPVFKTVLKLNQNSLLNLLADTKPAGGSSVSLQSLTIGNVSIDSTITTKLESTSNITTGVASSSKALVLDNNRNVSGINKIYCNELYINNVLLNPAIFNGGAVSVSTQDANRPELTFSAGVTARGKANSGKALIADRNKNVRGINSVKTVAYSDKNDILVNERGNNFKLTNIDFFERLNIKKNNVPVNRIFAYSAGRYLTDTNGGKIIKHCYSPNLEIFVACFDNNKIAYSYGGIYWTTASTYTYLINYIEWNSYFNKFIAVGSTFLHLSDDGINWNQTIKIYSSEIKALCWSKELNMMVASASNGAYLYANGTAQISDMVWIISDTITFSAIDIKYITSSKRFVGCTTDGICNIIISEDGKNWNVHTGTTQGQGNIKCICYSSTKNIIVMPSGASGNRADRVGFYSKDGGLTFKPYYINGGGEVEFSRIEWVGDMGIFVAISIFYATVFISYDGFNWKGYRFDTNTSLELSAILYDRKTKSLYFKSENSGYSYKLINNQMINSMTSYNFDRGSDYFSFNSTQTSGVINIGNVDGKMINFITENKYVNGYVELGQNELSFNAKNLNIACGNIIFANGNIFNSGSLSILNNTVEHPFFTEDYFKLNREKNNSIIQYNQSKDIITGGVVVNSLDINGSSFNITDNNAEYQNNKLGIASANRFILTNFNNEIKGINKINCKEVKIQNYLISNNNKENVNLENKPLFNQNRENYNQSGLTNIAFETASVAVNTGPNYGTMLTSDYMYYIKEINLTILVRSNYTIYLNFGYGGYAFTGNVAIDTRNLFGRYAVINNVKYIKELGQIFITTNAGVFYSKDGLCWKQCNMMSENGTNCNDISYSSSLDICVLSTNGSIMISKNGIDFKSIPDNRYSDGISYVEWIDSWGLFVAIAKTQSTTRKMFVYSSDGITWDHLENNKENMFKNSTIPTNLVYSSKLDMMIAQQSTNIWYTYDGKIWYFEQNFSGYSAPITWIEELEIFIQSSNGLSTFLLYYSYDGIVWIQVKCPTAINTTTYTSANRQWMYMKNINLLFTTITGGTGGILTIKPDYLFSNNFNTKQVVCEKNSIFSVDLKNNRVGLGVEAPQFALQLSEDLAFKPTSSTWATSSDERLKEDIQSADLDLCLQNIKKIPLKHYSWKKGIYENIKDKSQLGWIAQDVEKILPKSIETKNMYGIEDCKNLNNDQIIANLYGAVKKLIQIDDELEAYFQ